MVMRQTFSEPWVEEEETILTDNFCTSFSAVVKRRSLVYSNSKRNLFFEVCLPALLMIVGIAATSIKHVARSNSQILAPSRIDFPNQIILLDSHKHADLLGQLIQNESQ